MSAFAEFAVTTNFSFLRGGSHPEEFVAEAIKLGLSGIGIADRNTLSGVVRAHVYKREHGEAADGLRVVTGARLVFADATPDILAYPQDRAAYGRLCRLLTRGNLRAQKGDCILRFEDVLDFAEGQQFIVMEGDPASACGVEERSGEWLGVGVDEPLEGIARPPPLSPPRKGEGDAHVGHSN